LLEIFNLLANSTQVENLNAKPIANASILKEQQRMQMINHYVEANYQNEIDVNHVAQICNLTTPAFWVLESNPLYIYRFLESV
jgi:hypothetical protein